MNNEKIINDAISLWVLISTPALFALHSYEMAVVNALWILTVMKK